MRWLSEKKQLHKQVIKLLQNLKHKYLTYSNKKLNQIWNKTNSNIEINQTECIKVTKACFLNSMDKRSKKYTTWIIFWKWRMVCQIQKDLHTKNVFLHDDDKKCRCEFQIFSPPLEFSQQLLFKSAEKMYSRSSNIGFFAPRINLHNAQKIQ